MKRVWIVNHYAQDPSGPGGTRHFMLGQKLRDHGWETWIIAASVELNTQRQRLGAGEPARIESHEGVHFCWISTSSYTGSGIGRIRNMLTFALRILSKRIDGMLPPPDVIVGSTVHPFAAAAAALLARRHKVPFVFEVRDIWPETLVAMGRLRRHSPLTAVLATIEKWLCRRARRIFAVMPGYADHAAAMGIEPARVEYLPNGVDLDRVGLVHAYRKTIPFRIIYLGAHGMANDLGTLLQALAIIETARGRSDIVCDLIGEGPLKDSLWKDAARLGLASVRFLPAVPKAGVYAASAGAHAFVMCTRALPSVYRYGISMNKLFDYMAMGRPVIAALAAANDPIREAGAGITVAPERPEELADAILRLAGTNEGELRQLGLNGRRYVEEHHDMRRIAARIAALLDGCIAT